MPSIVDYLKTQRDEIDAQIRQIQSECCHPPSARESKNRSSTGGYDSSSDRYWTEHSCGLCNKRWDEDHD